MSALDIGELQEVCRDEKRSCEGFLRFHAGLSGLRGIIAFIAAGPWHTIRPRASAAGPDISLWAVLMLFGVDFVFLCLSVLFGVGLHVGARLATRSSVQTGHTAGRRRLVAPCFARMACGELRHTLMRNAALRPCEARYRTPSSSAFLELDVHVPERVSVSVCCVESHTAHTANLVRVQSSLCTHVSILLGAVLHAFRPTVRLSGLHHTSIRNSNCPFRMDKGNVMSAECPPAAGKSRRASRQRSAGSADDVPRTPQPGV